MSKKRTGIKARRVPHWRTPEAKLKQLSVAVIGEEKKRKKKKSRSRTRRGGK